MSAAARPLVRLVRVKIMNALARGFADAMRPPDRRPIYEWAAENVQLSQGRGAFFDPSIVPAQRVAFDFLLNPDVHQLNLVWPVGFGKSVFFEVWICWMTAENPCDAQFSHQTDRPAAQWVEKRVIPALWNCKATAPIMAATHRHKRRKLELAYANGATHYFGGASQRNLQDKSVTVVGMQEAWDFAPGMIAEGKART